jgi:exosortase
MAVAENNFVRKWALLALPLGYLWFRLIDNLRLEWSSNPQYSYGLVVPILVAGLLLRRWHHAKQIQRENSCAEKCLLPVLLCGALAFFYLPTRLVEEATPEWRPIQWLLGIETIGLTLYAIYLAGGKFWLRQLAFPIAFFLVAIPWPTLIEAPIIQGLSRMNAGMVVNVLGFLDVPAIQHGNTIEVSTGIVGISDACSGIRSFQSSLMISLFLGEFYLFNWRRRVFLIPFGFALAMLLNIFRASLLTWIAAKKGVSAIAEYHDEAGLTILLVCTALLWGAAWLLNLRRKSATENPVAGKNSSTATAGENIFRRVNCFGLSLVIWLVAVEGGVELWYHVRESHLQPAASWTVNFPHDNPTYQDVPITADDRTLLRFDEGQKGRWREADGTDWQAFYFAWQPGRVAGYLAKRHTPDICITAAGLKQVGETELTLMTVGKVVLPMRHYVFETSGGLLQVYQCHWEAGLPADAYTAEESARFNLIRGVWAGRGNHGQKVLEVILAGYANADQAKAALEQRLNQLIKVEN